MKKYLLKFYKIKQNVSDKSDYENICDAAIEYLKKSKQTDTHFIVALVRSLKKFKDPYLIALVYKILSAVGINSLASDLVPLNLLKLHFNKRAIRNSILSYINAHNLQTLDDVIINKLVYHETFTSDELFIFITNHKDCAKDFMLKTDSNLLYKQLGLIANCFLDHNIDCYLFALGSSSKLVAYKAYEAFSALFIEKTKKSATKEAFQENQILFETSLLIGFKEQIIIESPYNFIRYGFNFLSDRDQIIKNLETKNYSKLSTVIEMYTGKEVDSTVFYDIDLSDLCYSVKLQKRDKTYSLETNFDYLFDSKSFKEITDCLEI